MTLFSKELKVNIQYFYSNKTFTNSGIINFGKSLQILPALKSISLHFE